MKLLYVTDNRIFGYGGGCLECQKYYDALSFCCSNEKNILRVVSLDDAHPKLNGIQLFSIKKNRILDLLSRFFFHSTYFYFYWLKNKRKIFEYKPDVVILERSRLGFIAKELKKKLPNCVIACCLDNVEFDYVDGYFAKNKNALSKLKIWLEKKCVFRDEKNMFDYANQVFFLTNRDYLRSQELYGFCKEKLILPICIKNEVPLQLVTEKKTIAFIGSLDYGSNLDAVRWFLKNVWIPYYGNDFRVQLIVAGNNPARELLEDVATVENCILKKNFDDIANVIPLGSALVAPIQTGAGMKVKVADALSMGIHVIATDEALVGYEESEPLSDALCRANNPIEIKNAIDVFLEKNQEEIERISVEHKLLYKKFYSYERSRSFMKKFVKSYFG